MLPHFLIFTVTMDAEGYVTILKGALLPFLRTKFADREHRIMQDYDPKIHMMLNTYGGKMADGGGIPDEPEAH